MGKGDLKTKRGKLFRRTYGNTRPKNSTKRKIARQKKESNQ